MISSHPWNPHLHNNGWLLRWAQTWSEKNLGTLNLKGVAFKTLKKTHQHCFASATFSGCSLLKQDLHKNLGATCDHPKHPSTFPQTSAEYIYIYNSPMPPLKPWYMQLWSQWIPRPACIQVVAAQGFVCSAKPEVGFPWTRKTCVVNIFWATLFWNNKIMLITKVGAAYHHHTIGWLVLQQDQWGNSPNPNSSWKFEV